MISFDGKITKEKQKIIDDTISSFIQKKVGNKLSCTTCTLNGACCKNQQTIYVSAQEIDLIKSLVTNEIKQRANASLAQKQITGMYQCPFLNDHGKCDIYSYRPMVCAMYNVISPQTNCQIIGGGILMVNTVAYTSDAIDYDSFFRNEEKLGGGKDMLELVLE